MEKNSEEKKIRTIFILYAYLKGCYGFIEVLSGIGVFTLTPKLLLKAATYLTQGELAEDPRDRIANYILTTAHHYSVGIQLFAGLYLVIYGSIKVLIVVGLLNNKKWAYPTAIVTLSIFSLYQIYRCFETFSIWLVVLTALDLLFLGLVWHEYKVRKNFLK